MTGLGTGASDFNNVAVTHLVIGKGSFERHPTHVPDDSVFGSFSRMGPPSDGGGNHHWALVIQLTPLLSDEESDQR